MKHFYEKPETDVWIILQEKNILSGENGSSETTREEEGDIFG